ncbi:MAG: hypothetical protein WDA68_00580 [Phycisphaerae bacterium]
MKKHLSVLQIAGILSFLFLSSVCLAVETREIDSVRAKSVLNSDDLAVIDRFISDAIKELVTLSDFTIASRQRSIILARQGEQAQYSEQFSRSCREHIGRALEQSKAVEPKSAGALIRMNLLILIDSLEDVRLADLVISSLSDESPVVRYWALRALTRPELFAKASPNLKGEVIASLENMVETATAQELGLIIEFAGASNSPEADKLLLHITDTRINSYAKWSVQWYLPDIEILKQLFNKMTTASAANERAEFGVRFAQLYSYAMQKYIKDIREKFLTPTAKQQLISLLAEIEDKCIGRLTGLQQTLIRTAIERDDYDSLIMEHGRLFGDQTQSGLIPDKFGFNYGTDADGSRRTSPKVLPNAPGMAD